MYTPSFIFANASSLRRCRVSGVRGVLIEMTSAVAYSSSRDTYVASSFLSSANVSHERRQRPTVLWQAGPVVVDDLHLPGFCLCGHVLADGTEADEPNDLAGRVFAQRHAPPPPALAQLLLALPHPPQRREHEENTHVRRGCRYRVRRVGEVAAVLGEEGHVNIVVPDAALRPDAARPGGKEGTEEGFIEGRVGCRAEQLLGQPR